jgi:MFS family permease
VATLVGIGMFAAWLLTPQLVTAPESTGYGFGAAATTAALLLLPGSLLMMLVGSLAGPLARRWGQKAALALGAGLASTAFVLLGLAHTTLFLVGLWYSLMMVGTSLCYAALPNLIVAAVPRGSTGEATGFNVLLRWIGSAIGAQLAGSILVASTMTTTGLPSDGGYEAAYLVGAVVVAGALAVALLLPARTRQEVSVGVQLASAAVVPGPVQGGGATTAMPRERT